jgi:hypothetical protein
MSAGRERRAVVLAVILIGYRATTSMRRRPLRAEDAATVAVAARLAHPGADTPSDCRA